MIILRSKAQILPVISTMWNLRRNFKSVIINDKLAGTGKWVDYLTADYEIESWIPTNDQQDERIAEKIKQCFNICQDNMS